MWPNQPAPPARPPGTPTTGPPSSPPRCATGSCSRPPSSATRARTPLVDYDPRDGTAQVGIDDREGARLAAQHLVDLGHRRFGIVLPHKEHLVGGAFERCHVRDVRLAGWRDALEAAGVEWDSVPV